MIKKGRVNITAVCLLLVANLLVFSVGIVAYGDLSSAERENVAEELLSSYQNLPELDFTFAADSAVTHEEIKVFPYLQLAISEPNLEDGLAIAVITYEEEPYLLMATKLSHQDAIPFGAGLIDSTGEVVFVAEAHLESNGYDVEEPIFEIEDPGEHSETLELNITDKVFSLSTSLPKAI